MITIGNSNIPGNGWRISFAIGWFTVRQDHEDRNKRRFSILHLAFKLHALHLSESLEIGSFEVGTATGPLVVHPISSHDFHIVGGQVWSESVLDSLIGKGLYRKVVITGKLVNDRRKGSLGVL